MKTVTVGYANENSWSLGTCVSEQTYGDEKQYHQDCCLDSEVHTLTCKDSEGDGWSGGWRFNPEKWKYEKINGHLEINGVRYCEDFDSGSEQIHTITFSGRLSNIDNFLSDWRLSYNTRIINQTLTLFIFFRNC